MFTLGSKGSNNVLKIKITTGLNNINQERDDKQLRYKLTCK